MSTILPYFMAFLAVFCYASLGPIAKKILPSIPMPVFMGIAMGFLALFSGIFAWFYERDFSLFSLKLSSWGGIVLFSFINFCAFFFYLSAIKKIPIVEYQMFGILIPVLGGVVAFFLLGEPLKWRYLAALLFMGIGLFIALYDPSKSNG